MKTNSKIVSLTLIVIALLLVFGGCSQKSRIVGTWTDSSGGTMQFLEDGTVSSSISIIDVNGTYSFPDKDHIKIEYDGLLNIVGSFLYEYEISGDNLFLTDSDGDITKLTKN